MAVRIELPGRLAEALEIRAKELRSSVEAVAIKAIEKGLARGDSEKVRGRKVELPLIRSAKPGSLSSLTNAEIDALYN